MNLIVKLGVVAGLLTLAACGGGSPQGSGMEEIPVVSKKPWVYNPEPETRARVAVGIRHRRAGAACSLT